MFLILLIIVIIVITIYLIKNEIARKKVLEFLKKVYTVLFIIGGICIIVFGCLVVNENKLISQVKSIDSLYWKYGHEMSWQNKKIKQNEIEEVLDYEDFSDKTMYNLGIMINVSEYIGEEFRNAKYSNQDTVIAELKEIYPSNTGMYYYLIVGIVLIISGFIFLINKTKNKE